MRLFQRYSFSIPKKQKTGELVRKIFNLINEKNYENTKVLFSFSDLLESKISAQQRVAKTFPLMTQFCVEAPEKEESRNPLNALEIAEGIGRRFPFQTAQFIFWGVPASLLSADFGAVDESVLTALPELGACGLPPQSFVAVTDSWWVNGRNKGMTAALELPLPDDRATDVTVPEELEQSLSALAKIKERQLAFFPTTEEIEQQTEIHKVISPVLDDYKKSIRAVGSYLKRLNLPHPKLLTSESAESETETIPKKRIIGKHLKKLGYKHYGPGGGQGLMCFRKKSAGNNIISIEFDFGSWSKTLHASLRFRGPLTEFFLTLPYSVDGTTLSGIHSADLFSRAIENLSVVVGAVEQELIAKVEEALPCTPSWYASIS
jgi:hypothetical protein